MNDDRLDEQLHDAAQAYNLPPEPPRDEMWENIRAAREARRSRQPGAEVINFRRRLAWPIGLAALIALAFGLGRMTGPSSRATAPIASAVTTPRATSSNPAAQNTAYTVATVQHLARADAFLTGFRADARKGRHDAQFTGAARDLLSNTRLMLDSPDLTDPRLRSVLEDLELVLVQIAQLPSEHGGDQLDLITDGLKQRGFIPRLRSAIPAGPASYVPGES
ncbi:MAG: hypothetical protein ABJD11_02270 [Gemmatimonadota bacterium]